jgi:hypothetical protein
MLTVICRRIAILSLIADLLAMCKFSGFGGHSAQFFCSFCLLERKNIDDLNLCQWTLCVGPQVRAEAELWRSATTKVLRAALFAKSSVRWSPLHRLAYYDPVQHAMLGPMHNWLEGVLQHHARRLWGIGTIEPSAQKKDDPELEDDSLEESPPTDNMGLSNPNMPMEIDIDENTLQNELSILFSDNAHFHDQPAQLAHLHSQLSFQIPGPPSGKDTSDSNFVPQPGEDNGDESDGGDTESDSNDELPRQSVFSISDITQIQKCISNAILPTCIDHPPKNFGDTVTQKT